MIPERIRSGYPDLEIEKRTWDLGARHVAGVDEVGRGALAGPVVAAAVVLPPPSSWLLECLQGVRDSKCLSAQARCSLYATIVETASAVGVGSVGPETIDVLGIGWATQLAMVRALAALPIAPDYVLVDGREAPLLRQPQIALVQGDRRVLSIAAASIVAKLHRDSEMIRWGAAHPEYGFDAHKGYGTSGHQEAIRVCGPALLHRLSWAPLRGARPQVAGRQPRLRQQGLPGFRGSHGAHGVR